jgi:Ca-activated chloride channel family protein
MRALLSSIALVVAVVAGTARTAAADTEAHGRLAYLATDGTRAEMPIVKSDLAVTVRGPIAQVVVTQRYANPLSTAIDAIYVFPLPEKSAVGDMSITVGSRHVHAVIKRREEARQTYERAKRAGKLAALLDQERPNVFTQQIANLAPGEQIDVELRFDVLLAPDDGTYTLALPTVVGPRYIPGTAIGDGNDVGTGKSPDTDRVPDASRISPPVTTTAGNLVDVSIDLDAGLPVTSVASPTHALSITKRGDTARTIALATGATAATKDVVITWKVEVTQPTVAALADHDAELGHVALVVQPPAAPPAKDVEAREIVFVVDTSGSMKGVPLQHAQAAMRRALAGLRSTDRFRILNFSTDVGGLDGGASLAATSDNLARGVEFVNGLESRGGTEMLSGIRAALTRETPDIATYVCFMTDGFIGNETEIFAAIGEQLDARTRIFSFGVGSSVNRYLLDRMAELGRGAVDYILLDEGGGDGADRVIQTFLDRLAAPVLGQLEVDWGGLDVVEQTPSVLPDLFVGQPIVVVGRYKKGGKGTVTIRGERGGKDLTYSQVVSLPATNTGGGVLSRLWARRRIDDLDAAADLAGDPTLNAAEITAIALRYSLMSAYTSFVAVEESTTRDVAGKTVNVPVAVPEGVSPDGVGAEVIAIQPGGYTLSVDAAPPSATRYSTISGGGGGDSEDEEGYDSDGEVAMVTMGGVYSERRHARWHGALDGGLSIAATADRDPAGEVRGRAAVALTGSLERRLAGRIGAGLEAGWLSRFDRDDVSTMSAVLARWGVLRFLHLRLGLGAAYRSDGELGLAWHVRAGVVLPFGGGLGMGALPELSVRVGQARLGDEDDAVTVGLGLGLRW